MHHIEIIFNLNRKKEFCFCSSVLETKTFFGIVIFWVDGKNCIMKNEKCIAFPKSWYVNSNPVLSFRHAKQTSKNVADTAFNLIKWKYRPFQKRHAIACAHTHTRTTCDKSHVQIKLLTTRLHYITASVWSRCVPILMLTLNWHLSLIIKLKLHSWVFWFWKLLNLHKNQKGLLLSPVYNYSKGTFDYIRNEKGTRLKKTSNAEEAFFFETKLFKERMKKFLCTTNKRKMKNGYKWMRKW